MLLVAADMQHASRTFIACLADTPSVEWNMIWGVCVHTGPGSDTAEVRRDVLVRYVRECAHHGGCV